MADEEQHRPGGNEHQLSGHRLLCGLLAGVAVGAPLFGMMSFTLVASITLLFVASPLLLVVSPVLLFAGFVLASSLAGFGVSSATSLAGLWSLKWAVCALRRGGPIGNEGDEWAENIVTESRKRVKEYDIDLGGYSHRKLQLIPSEDGEIEVERK